MNKRFVKLALGGLQITFVASFFLAQDWYFWNTKKLSRIHIMWPDRPHLLFTICIYLHSCGKPWYAVWNYNPAGSWRQPPVATWGWRQSCNSQAFFLTPDKTCIGIPWETIRILLFVIDQDFVISKFAKAAISYLWTELSPKVVANVIAFFSKLSSMAVTSSSSSPSRTSSLCSLNPPLSSIARLTAANSQKSRSAQGSWDRWWTLSSTSSPSPPADSARTLAPRWASPSSVTPPEPPSVGPFWSAPSPQWDF